MFAEMNPGEWKPCARLGTCSSHEGAEGSQSAKRDRNQGLRSRVRPGGSLFCSSIYFRELSKAANWSPINQTWPTDEFY